MTFATREETFLFKIHNLIYTVMSVVPHGMFAAHKVRQNQDKLKKYENCDLSPTKYSSKYMNSIWGMYNRYSVHNFKKNIDANIFAFGAPEMGAPKAAHQSAERSASADSKKGSLPSAKDLLSCASYM